jgi:hypothetical protein
MDTELNKTTCPKDLKTKMYSPPRRSLREKLQQGTRSSGATLRGLALTSEPAAVISAKGRHKPMVRNLLEAKPGTSLGSQWH